jgi:hypothetical protein
MQHVSHVCVYGVGREVHMYMFVEIIVVISSTFSMTTLSGRGSVLTISSVSK